MHRPSIINPNAIFDLSIAIPYIRLDRCNTDTIGEWAVPAPSYMHAITLAHSHTLTCISNHYIHYLSKHSHCPYPCPHSVTAPHAMHVLVKLETQPQTLLFPPSKLF